MTEDIQEYLDQAEVWERWRTEVDKGQTPQRIDRKSTRLNSSHA